MIIRSIVLMGLFIAVLVLFKAFGFSFITAALVAGFIVWVFS